MRGRRVFSLSAFRQRSIPAAFALLAVQAVCVTLVLGQTGQKDAAPPAKAETPAPPSSPAQKPGDAGSPSSDSPPTPAWPGQRVWLSELPERNAQVGWGKLGKGGSLGFSDLKITFNGVPAPHGLGMHADARVEYDLAGKYRAFRATPAINDSAGGAGSEVPVVFRVLGDGMIRWESVGMHHSDTAQECLVDITGVKLLTLTVSYDKRHGGEAMYGHAVWLEPFVTATEPPATLRLWLAGEKQDRLRRETESEADARAWLKEGKYDELEKLADEARRDRIPVGGTPRLHWFYRNLASPLPRERTEKATLEHFDRLRRWRLAKPESITPYVIEAEGRISYAFSARGTGWASTVTEEGWKVYAERLKAAQELVESARKLQRDVPELCRLELSLAKNLGWPRERADQLVDECVKVDPQYYPVYLTMADFLQPRWGGAPGDVEAFADTMRQRLGGHLGARVYALMARATVRYEQEDFFKTTKFQYDRIKPGLVATFADSGENETIRQWSCFLACLAKDREYARELFDSIGPCTFRPAIWRGAERMREYRAWAEGGRWPLEETPLQRTVARLEQLQKDSADRPASNSAPPRAVAPFREQKATELQLQWAKHLGVPVVQKNSIGMRLVLIPPGEFQMGSTAEEVADLIATGQKQKTHDWHLKRIASAAPQHRVEITKPFYLGLCEVTQAEYEQVMGKNPSEFRDASRPVEGLSWDDATEFCRKLSESAAEKAAGAVYRLPTEAEWEYACRVGTATRFAFGNDPTSLDQHAWWKNNSQGRTQSVGRLQPNAWALFDVHGNVWEWCADWWGPDYYAKSPTADPPGPDTGTDRVLRGGAWKFDNPVNFHSTFRSHDLPVHQYHDYGFRVVRSLAQ